MIRIEKNIHQGIIIGTTTDFSKLTSWEECGRQGGKFLMEVMAKG